MSDNQVMNIDQVITDLDNVIAETNPAIEAKDQGFKTALILAKGIATMRQIFQVPQIKDLVVSMQDSALGFKTDRGPGSYTKKSPYTYQEVAECCIEALLKGYRLTNNEFNIIAGNFYPAKNGKFRKINEFPGLTNFKYCTTTPLFEFEERLTGYKQNQKRETVPVAKVQAFATWELDGKENSIGYDKDKLVFKIKVQSMMGDDAIIGKAQSKLFTAVLNRVSFIPVADGEIDEAIEITPPTGIGQDGSKELPLADRMSSKSSENRKEGM